MPLYKFRVCLEEDDSIIRDIEILPTQSFLAFHKAILKAFQFDDKHDASFYKSNESWHKGKEVALAKKENAMLMEKVPMVYFIDDPHQKIIYLYDFEAQWTFYCELMSITEEKSNAKYPLVVKSEGIAPKQYGNTPIVEKANDVFEETLAFDENEMNGQSDDELGGEKEEGSEGSNADGDDEGDDYESNRGGDESMEDY
jgi:Plasmid pRiA4b ORF-3-like protein